MHSLAVIGQKQASLDILLGQAHEWGNYKENACRFAYHLSESG